MHAKSICWLNGQIIPQDQAKISVFDHGLLYGDGVFEGIRFYGRNPFRMEAHLDRLIDSARALAMTIPLTNEQLRAAVSHVIDAFSEDDGYLRLVVTRGEGKLGLDPRTCKEPSIFIIADELSLVEPRVSEYGAKLIIASTRRLAPDGLDPRIRSLNYLNHFLARIEANLAGADEAILLNAAGRVAEGTADNVFIFRNRELLTPPPIEGALAGITREVVRELAWNSGISFFERPLAPYDLYTAEECFLTGTGAELIPVAEIDGRKMATCPGKVYSELAKRFHHFVREQSE
jgi:branched-chain amino acid aminotransferase